jgi:hypothetical protein
MPALPQRGELYTCSAPRRAQCRHGWRADRGCWVAGQPYVMTSRDLLKDNGDLIDHCAELLAAQPLTRLDVISRGHMLNVTTAGLGQLGVYGDGQPACAVIPVKRDGRKRIRLPENIRDVEVVGLAENVVRQRRRLREILPATVGGDEAEALRIVEPLHGTCRHV